MCRANPTTEVFIIRDSDRNPHRPGVFSTLLPDLIGSDVDRCCPRPFHRLHSNSPSPPTRPLTTCSSTSRPRPTPTLRFNQLALPAALLRAIGDLGFQTPTAIQAEAIPALLGGRDITGVAQTGTGKTAAFGLPLLASIDPRSRGVAGPCPDADP